MAVYMLKLLVLALIVYTIQSSTVIVLVPVLPRLSVTCTTAVVAVLGAV